MAVERKWTLNAGQTAAFHAYAARECAEADVVDDHTWADLEMGKVFARLDRSITPPGAQYLYSLLRIYRSPSGQNAEWMQLRDELKASPDAPGNLRGALHEMNRQDGADLADFIFGPPQTVPPHWKWYRLLPVAAIAALFGILLSHWFIFVAMALFFANICVHQRHLHEISRHAPSLVAVGILLVTFRKLIGQPAISKLTGTRELRAAVPAVETLHKKISRAFLRAQTADDVLTILVEYLNLLLLFEFLSCCRALEAVNDARDILARSFCFVGRVDALQGLALALPEFPHFCVPQIKPGQSFDLVDAYHPLIDSPVCNSISGADRSILLLGTNMAGKTTFMKTLAINLLLARTIGICLARKAVLPPARVRTLINRDDKTTSGQSYFFFEASELLRMLKSAGAAGGEYWFVIDEIFRGTNTVERIAAGSSVLDHLAGRWMVIASTHDDELSNLLADRFDSYHFSDVITANEAHFDYLLKQGPCLTRNAIKLLVLAGYPAEVTDRAGQLATAADAARSAGCPQSR